MERRVLCVCVLAGFFGIVAAILGFAAEAKHVRPDDVILTENGTCIYPRSPALGLGLAAAVSFIIGQLILSISAGCICCQKHPLPTGCKGICAVICNIISWMTFAIAFLLFLAGATLNDQHGEKDMNNCFVVKPGIFSGGSILSIATISLGIFSYITVSSAKGSAFGDSSHQNPPIPPQTGEPVFVPEDTYNRLQNP